MCVDPHPFIHPRLINLLQIIVREPSLRGGLAQRAAVRDAEPPVDALPVEEVPAVELSCRLGLGVDRGLAYAAHGVGYAIFDMHTPGLG